ncbi:hypothetical protein [Eubacterium sp. 1001713B170207_170306_E7]|uniref:hypothetical protein n=1 Tax=Eubacterium sp. 1001713B170207_170306_E7 TaxID=2787097 RepID=UPI00189938AB|nr:hypothetical protein [Eubacterium sp. 1001713B170207_170306_E7]
MDIVVENSKKLMRNLYLLLKNNENLNLEESADQEEEQKIRQKKYSLYKEMNNNVKNFLVNLVNFEDKVVEEEQEEKKEKMENNQSFSVKQMMLLEKVDENLEKNIDACKVLHQDIKDLNESLPEFEVEKSIQAINDTFSVIKENMKENKMDFKEVLSDIKNQNKEMEAVSNRIKEEAAETIRKEGWKQILVYGGSVIALVDLILLLAVLFLR